MKSKSFVSINDLSREKILSLLETAGKFEENPNSKILDGRVVGSLFFEPSTRIRLSFETAANRLGARVIGFSDAATSSASKGETLKDTIMMVSSYADVIVMRHRLEGAARYASEVSPVKRTANAAARTVSGKLHQGISVLTSLRDFKSKLLITPPGTGAKPISKRCSSKSA